MILDDLVGKEIYVVLKTNYRYTGTVLEVNGNLVKIKDRFGEIITFNSSEIIMFKEVKDETKT